MFRTNVPTRKRSILERLATSPTAPNQDEVRPSYQQVIVEQNQLFTQKLTDQLKLADENAPYDGEERQMSPQNEQSR